MTFPYYSQWGDIRCNEEFLVRGGDPSVLVDWRAEGFPTREEYLFWTRRICGLACLRSILAAWCGTALTYGRLLDEARAARALVRDEATGSVHGLLYRPFLDWIRSSYGLRGDVLAGVSTTAVRRTVSRGDVVIASVSSEIRYPHRPNVRRGGHLVLVTGCSRNSLTFHNPSGVRPFAEGATVDSATFDRFFAGRGMAIRRERA